MLALETSHWPLSYDCHMWKCRYVGKPPQKYLYFFITRSSRDLPDLKKKDPIFEIRRLLAVLIVVCSFAKCNKFVFFHKNYHLVSFILLQVGGKNWSKKSRKFGNILPHSSNSWIRTFVFSKEKVLNCIHK